VQARFQRPSAEQSTALPVVCALDVTASAAAHQAVEVSGSFSNCKNVALCHNDVEENTDTVLGEGISADGSVNVHHHSVNVHYHSVRDVQGEKGDKLVHDTTEQLEKEGINRDLTENMQSLSTDSHTQPGDCR
jgi:hypothetical protein